MLGSVQGRTNSWPCLQLVYSVVQLGPKLFLAARGQIDVKTWGWMISKRNIILTLSHGSSLQRSQKEWAINGSRHSMLEQKIKMSPGCEWIAALCIITKEDSKQKKTSQICIYNLYSGMKAPDCVKCEIMSRTLAQFFALVSGRVDYTFEDLFIFIIYYATIVLLF